VAFRFKLMPLQRYREHQRDLCRQALAIVLAEDQALVDRRAELVQSREGLLNEMVRLQTQARLPVDQAAARRYHAGQLQLQIRQVDAERQIVQEKLTACREALSKADQGVKVLEQLAERQLEEYTQTQEKKESREREEVWQAGNLAKNR
jgi:flagellar protein FliJ